MQIQVLKENANAFSLLFLKQSTINYACSNLDYIHL